MRKFITALALITALGVAACGGHSGPTSPPPPPDGGGGPPPPPPPVIPTLQITRILAFGDSLTEGVVQPSVTLRALDAGLPASYPYKLQALATARYTSQTITVVNAGKAGNRAQEDRQRLDDMISMARADVLLLMEGTNDIGDLVGLSGTALQNGITRVVNAMEDMVRDTQFRGVTPFVATIPAQRAGGRRGAAAALVAPYNDALKTMIARKGARLVDVHAQLPLALIGQDGLHPTDEGYQTIAKIFQTALAAVYEQPPPTAAAARR